MDERPTVTEAELIRHVLRVRLPEWDGTAAHLDQILTEPDTPSTDSG